MKRSRLKTYSPLRRTRFERKKFVSPSRRSRLKRGKKSRAWDRERRILKIDSFRNDRTTCELRGHPEVPHECTYDNYLSYGHDAKRRKLDAEGLKRAILICLNAHNVIEFWKPEEMKRIVNEVIANRELLAA